MDVSKDRDPVATRRGRECGGGEGPGAGHGPQGGLRPVGADDDRAARRQTGFLSTLARYGIGDVPTITVSAPVRLRSSAAAARVVSDCAWALVIARMPEPPPEPSASASP